MELLLTAEQNLLVEQADRICAVNGPAGACASDVDTARSMTAFRALADAGYLGLLVDAEHGGAGLGCLELSLLLRAAGRHRVAAPLAPAMIAAWAVAETTNTALRDRWLPEMLAGVKLIAPAGSAPARAGARPAPQPSASSDAAAVNGQYPFITGPMAVDAFLIPARTYDRPVLAIVTPDTSGVSLQARQTIDGARAIDLALDHSPLDAASIVATGDPAEALKARIADRLVIAAAAELLGIAEAAHGIANEHIKLRKQFGRPLGSNQVLQHRSVDGFLAIELLNSLLWQVARALDAGRAHPAMIAALNVKSVRTALAVTRAAMQMLGAIGYTAEHAIGALYRRSLLLGSLNGGEAGQRTAFARATGLHPSTEGPA